MNQEGTRKTASFRPLWSVNAKKRVEQRHVFPLFEGLSKEGFQLCEGCAERGVPTS